jgi:hypothetical protein
MAPEPRFDEESEKFGHLTYRVVRTARHKLVVWKDPTRRSPPGLAGEAVTEPRGSTGRGLGVCPAVRR